MPEPFGSYNVTTAPQNNRPPVYGTVGDYRVQVGAPPPPKVDGTRTWPRSRRPDSRVARRGAYKSLKKAGMLPKIEPVDISKSQTNGGTQQATNYLGQAREWFCSAVAPSHASLDQTQDELRQYARYLPNAFGIAFRTYSASVVETFRWMCLEPADREKASLTTDLPSIVEKLDRPPKWTTARLIENTASGLYHVINSEFGGQANATSLPEREIEFRAAVTPPGIDQIIPQIDRLPIVGDSRPSVKLSDLRREIRREFTMWTREDHHWDQPIQGRILVMTYRESPDMFRQLLRDVSRNDDILLTTSDGRDLSNEVELDDPGLLPPNLAQIDHCLGMESSRCFAWDQSPHRADELAFEMGEVALYTIDRYPARTVFIVTDESMGHSVAAVLRRRGDLIEIEQPSEEWIPEV